MAAKTDIQKPTIGSIARQGILGALIALAINAVLYFAGAAAGGFPPEALTQMGVPVDIVAIANISVMATVAALVVYFVLTRLLSRQRAQQIFVGLAVLILLGMGITPFTIANAPVLQIVLLEVMHLVLGGSLVYFLLRA